MSDSEDDATSHERGQYDCIAERGPSDSDPGLRVMIAVAGTSLDVATKGFDGHDTRHHDMPIWLVNLLHLHLQFKVK
jgi:hypothetical protein